MLHQRKAAEKVQSKPIAILQRNRHKVPPGWLDFSIAFLPRQMKNATKNESTYCDKINAKINVKLCVYTQAREVGSRFSRQICVSRQQPTSFEDRERPKRAEDVC